MGLFTMNQQPDNDVKRGTEALEKWHNQALRYPQNYNSSFGELQDRVKTQYRGALLEGLGLGITSAGMSDADVRAAMVKLADAGEGKLPAKTGDWFNALQAEATSFHFLDAVGSTLSGTVADLGKGLAGVGDASIGILKSTAWLSQLLPFMAFAALGYVVFVRTKQFGGK